MALNDAVNWHEFFEDGSDDDEQDDPLFEMYLKHELQDFHYEKNRDLLSANSEMVQANVDLRRKLRAVEDEKSSLIAEILEMKCEMAIKSQQLNGSRVKEETASLSDTSSALG